MARTVRYGTAGPARDGKVRRWQSKDGRSRGSRAGRSMIRQAESRALTDPVLAYDAGAS